MTEAVQVRPAARADIPRIWELLNGLALYERWEQYVTGTAERLAAMLFDAPVRAEAIVAEQGGVIVGYALFYPGISSFRTHTKLWLEDLFVDPGMRGGGIGRALVAALARLAVQRGHMQISWHVLDWNAPSIGFYERIGAERVATDVFTYALSEAQLRSLAATND